MRTNPLPGVTRGLSHILVQPSAEHRWEVIVEGRPRSFHFTQQETALGYARILATVNRPSTVTVYGLDSDVQGQWTFDVEGRRLKG